MSRNRPSLPRFLLGPAAALLLAAAADAQYLFVSSFETDEIKAFHAATGTFVGDFVPAGGGGIDGPAHLVNGPDGRLYAGSRYTYDFRRYDPATGAFQGVFAPSPALQATCTAFAFGADGHLYAVSHFTREILRFDGTTGAFLGAFVPAGSGGLDVPAGLTFGPDGHLYVSSRLTHQVKRYHGTTGAFLDNFVSTGSGGLVEPLSLVFGPDGHLYVCGVYSDAVHRYDGSTGAFMGNFVTPGTGGLSFPYDLLFLNDGTLCVSGWNSHTVIRCDGTTGAFLNVAASGNGINRPTGLAWAAGFTPALAWQFNQPAASLDVDGLAGSAVAPPPAAGCAGTIHLASTHMGLPWLLPMTSPESPVAAGSGGTAVAGGQVLNIDASAAGFLVFDGGPWNAPAGGLAIPYSLPSTAPAISAQMAVADPGQPAGFSLSSCVRIEPAPAAPAVLAGPTVDDTSQEVVLAGLACGGASVRFCGTWYTSIFVSSNGFVSFGSGSADPSPTVAEFAASMPRLAGAWTDLNPGLGGAITISAAGSVLTVSYACVTNTVSCNPFLCVQGLAVVDLEFDLAGGACAIRNYGATTVPSGFAFPTPLLMGMTPGGGAQDPGSQNFLSQWGTGPRTGPANAMVYQFNPAGAVPPGFASITFPNADPTAWVVN